ncbi:response regulator transcription factor [Lentibacillus halophilus]|uniref:Response regulator transcription factor n=1 Tax=Lentibacillus halophilus TaxID=295065 RepID=A0ABN0Z2Y2_9BACI
MKQTILVVDDDSMIRGLIRMHLEKHQYDVVEAHDGEEAQKAYCKYNPCLIILDLMLPTMSGEAFCEWVQAQEQTKPSIIMLSAKSRVDDKISGLKMGADDYLTKPFEPEELVAHVEAVLRRTSHHCQAMVHNGLCIKPREGEVHLNNEPIQLTTHEFHLLHLFMQNPGFVFSREKLIDQLYPHAEHTVLDRTVDAHIKKLREKIETAPSRPEHILTVRGMGYKFARV